MVPVLPCDGGGDGGGIVIYTFSLSPHFSPLEKYKSMYSREKEKEKEKEKSHARYELRG